MKKYFHALVNKYLSYTVRPSDTCYRLNELSNYNSIFDNSNPESLAELQKANYVVLNGILHYERDIQNLLEKFNQGMSPDSKLIITYYSSLWKSLFKISTYFGMRKKTPELNWLTHDDIENLTSLSGYIKVSRRSYICFPLYIPILSTILNKFLSNFAPFQWFNMIHYLILKPEKLRFQQPPSVSIIVPARNESGNLINAIKRVPKMGPNDELIFIEGNSTDNTWDECKRLYNAFSSTMNIQIAKQDGKGKGDAVRKGFAMAKNEILMILDADLTVPPETLPKFYQSICSQKADFINGSRLVYPMDHKAMRFLNLLGNKFFAFAFSWVLGQKFKDTLCGTKVIWKRDYERLASNRDFFGNFDPFGDFDLIFGASRMALKTVEIPIVYKERVYGATNISRWKHGFILLVMLVFSIRKIRFY